MNERDLRTKKQSLVIVKNINDKTFNNSHIKLGPNCEPKQPPNISRHYLETRKKQAVSKELIKQDIMIYCYEVQRVKSKILMQTRQSRPSHSKYQEDHRLKKTKRQPHYISKPHKAKGPKICSKQNRQSRSNMDFEEQRRDRQKMTKTQVFQDKNTHIHNSESLTCKQKIMKKLKKNIKSISYELQNESKTKTSNLMMIQVALEHVTPKKSFAEEMGQFQQKITKMQIQFESNTLSQLFCKEQLYSNIPNYNCYLNRNQSQITWTKRAKVMNWMIQILSEMGSRREVFGLAVNYIDRYLASTYNLEQDRLQILACAAMSIANKIQGLTFSIGSFRIPGISFAQILQLEQQVCRVLKWKLNPPTLNMWGNRMAQHWDLYLQHNANILPKILQQNIQNIRFKDTESYLNFRTLMQYIDLVLLDIETLQYHNRELAASFIYLMLTQKLNMYSKKQIFVKFPTSSQYLIRENDLNDFYCEFLQKSFGFSLQDLLPTVQYCSTFVMLPLTFQLPAGVNQQDNSEIPFSEFCSLITYNTSNLNYLNSRSRQTD